MAYTPSKQLGKTVDCANLFAAVVDVSVYTLLKSREI